MAGTRAAAFAPVRDLGLVAVWDDGDDLYAEPRAPYPHTREVLLLRAHETGCAALVGGTARSVEASALVTSGWAAELRGEPRGGAPARPCGPHQRRDRPRAGARPGGEERQAAQLGVRRDPHRPGAGPGAGADPARRLRRVARLRPVPRAGALPTLRRPAAPALAAPPADLPLVRRGRAGLELRRVRWPGVARACAGRPPHRRGAGPGVPTGARAPLVGGAGPRPGRSPAGDRRRDTGGGAAGDGRLRRGGPARHLADARAGRPADDRGVGAALVQRGDAGPPGRPTVARWSSWATRRTRRCRRWSGGTRPGSPSARRRSGARPTCPQPRGLRCSAGPRRRSRRRLPSSRCRPEPSCSVRCPSRRPASRPVRTRSRRVRAVVRVPRRSGPALSRRSSEMQGVRAARKLPAVRVQVDPYALG